MKKDGKIEAMECDAPERENRGNKLKAFALKIWRGFENALYPTDVTCDACGNELTAPTRLRLCSECVAKLPKVGDKKCVICGVPISGEGEYCLRCQKIKAAYRVHRAPLVYEDAAKQLIFKLKFASKRYIAQTLGAMMADTFLQERMKGDVVTYVPMTKAEEKKRGFNQAQLLAEEVAGRLKLPVAPTLKKTRDTSAQKELGGKDRRKNLEGAFECTLKEVGGQDVLLVDDVFTTGATADECAKALIKKRAKNVDVLTAAVTVYELPSEGKKEENK